MADLAFTIDPTHIDLGNTIGALQIGCLLGVFLFGVVTLQTWNYYKSYRDDGWINKTQVAIVWILEIAHMLAINYEVYRATILQYGKPWLLVRFKGIGTAIVFRGGITLVTQTFFARRLSKLLPRPYNHIGYFCIAVSAVRFTAALYLNVEGIRAPTISKFQQECKWIVFATLIASAGVNIVIAMSMLFYLSRQKKQVMRTMTSKLLDRLVIYTISTGLLTSVAAIVLIICFQVMPNNLIWLAVYTFLAKLYSNSFLSALNVRKDLRRDIIKTSILPDHFTAPDRSLDLSVFLQQEGRSSFQPVSVTMNTTKETIASDPDSPKSHSEPYRDEFVPGSRSM